MSKRRYEVLYGFEYENLDKKIEQCLSLPLAQRYNQIISTGEFLRIAKQREDFADVRRTFKSVQILEQK
jgi:hypothetical protein